MTNEELLENYRAESQREIGEQTEVTNDLLTKLTAIADKYIKTFRRSKSPTNSPLEDLGQKGEQEVKNFYDDLVVVQKELIKDLPISDNVTV